MRHLIVLIALSLSMPAVAADWVIVTRRQGVVECRASGGPSWMRILANRRLAAGDEARTEAASNAQVRFADGTVVAMGPETTVQVERLLDEVRVAVPRGALRASLPRYGGRPRFQVTTPNAALAAQGTEFLVEVRPGETRAAVIDGEVLMTHLESGRFLLLRPGDTASVDESGSLLLNPPSFTHPDALREFKTQHGLESGSAERSPVEHSTVFESQTAGTGFSGHRVSTDPEGEVEVEIEDGSPVLVNPNEDVGTGGIRLRIPR